MPLPQIGTANTPNAALTQVQSGVVLALTIWGGANDTVMAKCRHNNGILDRDLFCFAILLSRADATAM
jgi:hypothetical protein